MARTIKQTIRLSEEELTHLQQAAKDRSCHSFLISVAALFSEPPLSLPSRHSGAEPHFSSRSSPCAIQSVFCSAPSNVRS